jgi:hypothetical protein
VTKTILLLLIMYSAMNNSNELSLNEAKEWIEETVKRAETDPVVFIDNFLYTFDPKRPPYHWEFNVFDFQVDLIHEIKKAIEEGNDIFIEKCREMGATYIVLAVLLWFWRYVPGSNFLVGSRKESYVDNTKGDSNEISNKEESLFGKMEYMINHLDPILLPKGFHTKKHMTYMALANPENGNAISGESSNSNFSRGGRFKAILLDEFAFWDNAVAAWGSTADTTNCRIVLTTPGIKPGKAKKLRFGKDGEAIKIITLPYTLDPRKTKEWLDKERSRRSAEDFAREIMINWEASITGRVYPEIKQAEVGDYPYNSKWSMFVAWDFGLDGVAIQFWQSNPLAHKMRLVDCYSNSDKPIQYYFPVFGIEEFVQENGVLIKCKELFAYTNEDLEAFAVLSQLKDGTHFGDPDVAKHSLLTGTSTYQALSAVGIFVETKPESNDFISRRERTKVMLQSGIEVNDNPRTEYWYESMLQARYPQRQENSQVTTAVNLPIHDWSSHHRTATEYLAVNHDIDAEPEIPRKKKPEDTRGTFAEHLKKMRNQRIMKQIDIL